jgi:hypothetical protein
MEVRKLPGKAVASRKSRESIVEIDGRWERENEFKREKKT